MSDFVKHYFCIEGKVRLGLEWLHERINFFVSISLAHFGMGDEICVNGIAVKASFDELLNFWPADFHFIVVPDVMAPYCYVRLWKPIE